MSELLGYHVAVDLFGRKSDEPIHHADCPSHLAKNVPERLDSSFTLPEGDFDIVLVDVTPIDNAVFDHGFARSDRGPDDRRLYRPYCL